MSRQQIHAVLASRMTWLTGSLVVTALLTTAVAQDRANDMRRRDANLHPSATQPADRKNRLTDLRASDELRRKLGRTSTQPNSPVRRPPFRPEPSVSTPPPGTPASALPGRSTLRDGDYAGPPAPIRNVATQPAPVTANTPPTASTPPAASTPPTAGLDAKSIHSVDDQELQRKMAAARQSVGLPTTPAAGAPATAPAQPGAVGAQPNVPRYPGHPGTAVPPTLTPGTTAGVAAPTTPAAGNIPPMPAAVAPTPGAVPTPGSVPPVPAVGMPGPVPPGTVTPGAAAPAPGAMAGASTRPATGANPATPPAPAVPLPEGVAAAAAGTATAPAGVGVNATTGLPEVKPKAFYWLSPTERPYFISWNNITVEKACHDLEEMSGLSMIGLAQLDPAMKNKTITFIGTKLLNYDQALTKVNELLVELGAWVIQREDHLVVRQLSEWYQHIGPERRYSSLEDYRAAKLPMWELAAVVYDKPLLRPADVLAAHAMDVVPFNTARITIVSGTGRLELKGFVYFIEQQIKDIENNTFVADDGRTWIGYELEHATSGDAVRLLQIMVATPEGGAPRPMPPRPVPPNVPGQQQPQQDNPGSSTTDQIEIQEDTRLNRVMVRASQSNHAKVKELLKTYIDLPLKRGTKFELVKLEHADPVTVVNMVQPLMGERQVIQVPQQPRPQVPGQPPQPQPPMPPPQVMQVGTTAVLMPISARNSILVKANPDEMAIVKQYIEMVDVEGTKDKFQYVSLKYGSANSVANILNMTFGQRPSRIVAGAENNPQFRATADMQNDRGLVITGDPKDIDDAKTLIGQLDVDPDEGAVERLVTLEHSSANTLAEMLNGRYRGSSGRFSPGGAGGGPLPRFIADDASRSLIVVCRDTMWKDIERLIKEVDENSQVHGTTKTYRLKHAMAQNVAMILNQSFGRVGGGHRGGSDPDAASFQAETQSNVVVVTAMDEVHERISKLIQEIDQPSPSEDSALHSIELANAEASYVAEKIEELFHNPQGGGMGGRLRVPVNAVAEPVSNRVLVTASEDDFKEAEGLAKQIDKQYAERQFGRRTFHLEHVPTFKVQQALQMMFPQNMNRMRGEASVGGVRFADVGDDIIVSAPKDKMDEIEKLIKELDTDPSKDNEIRTYRVKGGDEGTRGIAESLEQLFGEHQSGYEGRRRGGGGSIQFIGDRGSDLLFVSAPAARMPEIDAKIQEMLKARQETDLTLSIREFEVTKARPEDVVEMVQPLLTAKYDELQRGGRQYGGGGGVSITPHPSGKRVMIAAPEALMKLADELIRKFDEPGLASMQTMIKLKTAKAEEIASIIEQSVQQRSGGRSPVFRSSRRGHSWRGGEGNWGGNNWNQGGGSSGSSEPGELQVIPVESSNSLILRGPEEKVLEGEKLAKELDKEAIPDGPIIKIFEIKDADVYDVVSMIEELVGGGEEESYGSYSGSSSGRNRRTSQGSPVIVRTESENKILVSATADKFPMIEQLIETKEGLERAKKAAGDTTGNEMSVGHGEILKVYTVKGPLNEIAKALDDSLVAILGYFDAPYVKTSPLASQIIVQGKPAHFKLVEQYLAEIEKNPPKPVQAVLIRQIPGGMAQQVLMAVQAHAPTGVNMNVQPLISRRDRQAAMRKIKEINIDTPISTEPAPFVPPSMLSEIEQSLSTLGWAQAPRITVSTQPAATTRPAVTTQPASITRQMPAPAVATQPAARAPQAPAPQPSPAPVKTAPVEAPAAAPAPAPAVPTAAPAPVKTAPVAVPAAALPVAVPTAAPAGPASAVPAPAPAGSPPAEDTDSAFSHMANAATQAIASGQVQIRYDEEAGLIYAVGPEGQLTEVQKLMDDLITQIEKLTDLGGDRPIRVFQVNYVDVTVASTILEQMFNDRAARQVPGQPPQPQQQQQQPQAPQATGAKKTGDEKGGKEDEKSTDASRRRREEKEGGKGTAAARAAAGGERIRVFPDIRTRTLIVRADKEDFPVIAELLLKIDRPGDRPPVDIKIFEITKLNAFDVEQAIKAILKIDDNRQSMYGGQMPFGGGMRGGYPGGLGNYGAQAQMVEQLQQQMLDLQAQGIEGITGETGEGKMKINPAKDITITSDATTNTVIVSAPEEGMKLVETLINRLEKITVPVQIVTFPLKNAEAEKVASELEKLFQGAGSRAVVGGGNGSGRSRSGGLRGGLGGGMMGGMGGGSSTSARLGQELKVTADARTNTIVVRALEADMPKIKELIDKLDTPSQGIVQLYPIEHGSAVTLAETLGKMFTMDIGGKSATNENAVRITADADTNAILVSAPESKQAIIGARIAELDKLTGVARVPKQIPLMVANASDVAEKLQAIFVPKGSGGKGVRQITIEGDDNSGILFVTAPQEMVKDIENIAKTLDTKTRTDVQVFKLKYAYATEVHAIFKDMLTQALTKLRGGKTGTDEVPVVTPDARTNSLIVMGTPAVFLAVERVLKDVDIAPGDTSTQTVAMFGLTKATAANVAQTINAGAPNWPKTTGVSPPSAVAEPTANVVYVYGTKAQIDQIKTTIIDPLEKYQPAVDAVVQDYQIPLKFAKVEEVAKTLTSYFQGKAQNATAMGVTSLPPADRAVAIIADPATRQLLVTASEKNKKLIDSLLAMMDKPEVSETARQTKVFPLQYADPSSTTLGITTSFAKTGQVSEIEQVKVVPELGTNSVVVSASSENMKKIEAMLLELDKPGTGTQKPYTIEIVNAEPEDVAAALNEVYVNTRGRTRTGRQPISITVPRGSKTLLVSCTEPELAEIKALVAQLDQSKEKARDVRMVRVEHIPVEEMVNLLTEYMRRSGRQGRNDPSLIGDVKIVASTSASAVLLTGPPERLKELEALVTKIDQSSPTTQPAGRLVKVIPLKNADPTSVAGLVTQTYTKPGNVAENDRVVALAEWTTNSVVVNANAKKQEEIATLIENLDKEPPNGSKQEIIKLEYARADDLASVLTQTYRQGRRGRQGDQPVMISADNNTNSLIVSAGRADLEGIKATVTTLDKPATSSIEELRMIPLKYIEASETLTILQEYLRKPGGGKGPTGSNLVGDIRLQASPTLNAIVVSGTKENIDAVEAKVQAMDQEMPNAGSAPRVVKLANASASQVAANLTRIFSDPNQRLGRKSGDVVPIILADDSTNSLIVRARPVDFNMIQDMAEKLDVKSTVTTSVDIIPIGRGVDVKMLATEIETRVNTGEKIKAQQLPGYRPAQVSVGADERGPALIVTGSPELFPVVRDTVTKLEDVRPVSQGAGTIVVTPRFMQASDVKRIIEQMVRAQKPGQQQKK